MNVFKFVFRKLEGTNTSIDMVETWMVKWHSPSPRFEQSEDYCTIKTNIQAFTSKENARAFASELRGAISLLGNKGYTVKVYKQNTPTNAV